VKLISGITKVEKNDEWYTNRETVLLMYDLLNVRQGKTVICPFDTEVSNFVKVGNDFGFQMLYGMRDWLDNQYNYDYLITNPPFSIKDQVIEKCLKSGKPSALVLPIDSLGGKRRHSLYKQYNYPTVYIPTRRINYISVDGQQTKANLFHSVVLLLNDPLGNRTIWQ
jgi:hypothetical protein